MKSLALLIIPYLPDPDVKVYITDRWVGGGEW